ncbi:MAG: HPF/RaiA family ribosome-associated protein [Pedobacter sp.]|nr:MAG: HPF/RaiA family ribosome-associated protein [Pedobacter sp.]
MIIQLNSDKNLTIRAEYENQIKEKLNTELDRFSQHISRLEAHLADENGNKSGLDDKKCLLEARIEGRPPIAASDSAQNYDLAIDGAISKLKSKLISIIGKMKDKSIANQTTDMH